MSEGFSAKNSGPTLKGHILALDALRGLAVSAVFALHYHPDQTLGPPVLRYLDRAAELGWAGVSLFFALSGFLITGILWDSLGRSHWWRNFYIRRSLRIFPLYYLVLILTAIVALIQGASLYATSKISIDFLYLTDIPGLWTEMFGFPLQSALVHFWSLAVEEQFYLVWPFLILAFAKNRPGLMKLCGGIWLASFAFRIYTVAAGLSWLWPHHFLLSRAGELCAGSLLALALRCGPIEASKVLRITRVALWVSFLSLIVLVIFGGELSLMNPLWSTLGVSLCSIFFTSLIAECLTPTVLRKCFENSALCWLGKISYGVYVYHLLLYAVFEKVTASIAPVAGPLEKSLILVAVSACGTLAVASLSFYTFERVFLLLKDKLAGSGGGRASPLRSAEPALSEPQ